MNLIDSVVSFSYFLFYFGILLFPVLREFWFPCLVVTDLFSLCSPPVSSSGITFDIYCLSLLLSLVESSHVAFQCILDLPPLPEFSVRLFLEDAGPSGLEKSRCEFLVTRVVLMDSDVKVTEDTSLINADFDIIILRFIIN